MFLQDILTRTKDKISNTLLATNGDIESQTQSTGGFFGNLFGQTQNQDNGFFSGICTLTRTQRIWGFILSIVLGTLCMFLSTIFLPTILVTSRKFALLYTLGNLLLVGSTTFLMGPMQQLKTMFNRERVVPSVLYLTSMILTIVCAIQLQNFVIMIALIIIQIIAMFWYILSYIPFAQRCFGAMFTALGTLF